MAPLPENNTDRLWMDYSDGINEHSFQVRFAGGASQASVVAGLVSNFFSVLSPVLYELTVLGCRYSLAGSVFSAPIIWPGPATFGQFAMPATLAPRQLCWLGRGPDGRRVRWYVFGFDTPPPTPFRLPTNSPAELGLAWDVIEAGPQDGAFLTISGSDPNLYNYIDLNYNSYYEEKSR